MKKRILSVLLIAVSILQANSQSELKQQTIDSLMRLNFEEFDQNMEGGWRLYANKLDFETATYLIKLYLEKHQDLETGQHDVMSFHCGQMLAYIDRNQEAISYMEASKKKENDFMHWNVYVDATIAFLNKDKETFSKKKEELAQKSMFPKDQNRNLIVLERLEANFDKTYQEASKSE